MKSDRIPPSRRRSARGLTITEVLVILALLAVLLAMGVPMFQRVGCNAMRDVSRANLAALGQAHAIAPVEDVGLILLHLAQAQLRIWAAGVERFQIANGALRGGAVIGVDRMGGIDLDVLDAAQARIEKIVTGADGRAASTQAFDAGN